MPNEETHSNYSMGLPLKLLAHVDVTISSFVFLNEKKKSVVVLLEIKTQP